MQRTATRDVQSVERPVLDMPREPAEQERRGTDWVRTGGGRGAGGKRSQSMPLPPTYIEDRLVYLLRPYPPSFSSFISPSVSRPLPIPRIRPAPMYMRRLPPGHCVRYLTFIEEHLDSGDERLLGRSDLHQPWTWM